MTPTENARTAGTAPGAKQDDLVARENSTGREADA